MSNEDELQSAVLLLNGDKKSEAILLLKAILKSDRDNSAAWLLLSACMDNQKDVDYCIKEAFRGSPDNSLIKTSLEQLAYQSIDSWRLERIHNAILQCIKPQNGIVRKIEQLNKVLNDVKTLEAILGIPIVLLYVPFVLLAVPLKWSSLIEQTAFLALMIPLFFIVLIVKAILKNVINSLEAQLGIKPEVDVEKRSKKNFERIFKNYSRIKDTLNIPVDAKRVNHIKYGKVQGSLFVWKTANELYFFPDPPTRENFMGTRYENEIVIKLSHTQIEYFSMKGEIFRENVISGGGGGGSSVAGAVIGGAIAGVPGAIIGGRKDIKDIQSKLVTHDTRETVVSYFDETNQRCSMFFDLDAFEVFNDLIPEKEVSIIKTIKSSILVKQETDKADSKNITDQIRDLAKLRDEGLLTEEEFSEKKKILLGKIQ